MKMTNEQAAEVLRGNPSVVWKHELIKLRDGLEIANDNFLFTQGKVAILREVIGLYEKAEQQLKLK